MKFSSSSPPPKILDHSQIPPAPPSSGELRPPLPLTFFDMLWINYSPVERLFFYDFPHSSSHFLHSHLPLLKSSLSSTLSSFYPLASSLRRRRPDGRFEIAPAASDSVPLTISEYAGPASDFLDISGDHLRPVEKLLPLAPQLPTTKSPDAQPLLALQITLFPNHGLCLSLAVHHVACDGFSSMHFVKSWSAAAAAAFRPEGQIPKLPPPPFMGRAVIPDPRNLYSQMEKAVFGEGAEEKMVNSGIAAGGVFAATFTLSAAEIRRLKKKVENAALELQGTPCPHCSSFAVSCAYAWICLLKTRRVTDGQGAAHFVCAVDWRRRIRPPIPAHYFGNCLSGCFVKVDGEEVVGSSSEVGMLKACAAIGRGIEELGEDAHECMDGVVDRLGELAKWRPMTLAGSPKMGVYGTDFGWGRPRKVEVISTRETGAMALAESRDGEGGIEVGVLLPEEDLKAFAEFFDAGLAC